MIIVAWSRALSLTSPFFEALGFDSMPTQNLLDYMAGAQIIWLNLNVFCYALGVHWDREGMLDTVVSTVTWSKAILYRSSEIVLIYEVLIMVYLQSGEKCESHVVVLHMRHLSHHSDTLWGNKVDVISDEVLKEVWFTLSLVDDFIFYQFSHNLFFIFSKNRIFRSFDFSLIIDKNVQNWLNLSIQQNYFAN